MDHFRYRDGALNAEEVPLAAIAARVGTPFYCYSTATMGRHYGVFADALAGLDALICYAVKANGNISVIRTLSELGAGADVVSGGELKRALVAGVPARDIVFSGVGKTTDEMAAALDAGIMQFNVESEPELESLGALARERGIKAPVALRVNPDVDAETHDKIATGRSENKFGIDWRRIGDVYARAAAMPFIETVGLAVHIGSQVTDLAPFEAAFRLMRELVGEIRAQGLAVDRLDLGGGLGIDYGEARGEARAVPTPAEYGELVRALAGDLECRLILEPGRVIVGNAGLLVTRVIYLKRGASRDFAVVDAAMTDLLRPALYGAHHLIVPVTEPAPDAGTAEVDVVGPVCETGDTLGARRRLPPLKPGDLLAVRGAGAYGAVMASAYNARALAPEVLVNGDAFSVVRERIVVDDLLAREAFPRWLEEAAPGMPGRVEGRVAEGGG